MSTSVRIALDAMGGDHGPSVVIPGAAHALKTRPDMQFLLYGDEAKLAPYLAQHPELKSRSRVIHTDVAVTMDDKPSQWLRPAGEAAPVAAPTAKRRGRPPGSGRKRPAAD